MLVKERLDSLDNFQAFAIKIDDEEIIFRLKKLTIGQKDFLRSYLIDNLESRTNGEILEILEYCIVNFDEEMKMKIIRNSELLQAIMDNFFIKNDYNLNFIETVTNFASTVIEDHQRLINQMRSILLNFGYKLLDFKDMTQTELIKLFIEENLYRNKVEFATFMRMISLDPTKEDATVLPERQELYDIIEQFAMDENLDLVPLNGSQKKSIPGESSFEKLSAL